MGGGSGACCSPGGCGRCNPGGSGCCHIAPDRPLLLWLMLEDEPPLAYTASPAPPPPLLFMPSGSHPHLRFLGRGVSWLTAGSGAAATTVGGGEPGGGRGGGTGLTGPMYADGCKAGHDGGYCGACLGGGGGGWACCIWSGNEPPLPKPCPRYPGLWRPDEAMWGPCRCWPPLPRFGFQEPMEGGPGPEGCGQGGGPGTRSPP